MNNYLIKLKHILPYTVGMVLAVVVGYGVLRWLVTVVLGIDIIKQETWNIHIPILLSIAFVFIPSKRLDIIKEESSSHGCRSFIHLITMIMVSIMLVCSQRYIQERFSRIVQVENITEIDSLNAANYYYIDNIKVNAYVFGHYVENRTFSKRGKETIRFNLYVVYPFIKGGNSWYALKFSKRIDRMMMDDEQIQQHYQTFLNECSINAFKYDFNQYHAFRRISSSDDKDGFVEALKKLESADKPPIDIKNALFLEPLPDGIEGGDNGFLSIVLLSLVIGLVLILITLYFAQTDSDMIHEDGRLKEKEQEGTFEDFIKGCIIPRRHNCFLVLIIITIVGLFLLMTICGVNMLSPSGKELWQWGALSTEGFKSGEWWRIVSHMFVHGGLSHFLCNIVGLLLGVFFLMMQLNAHRIALIFIVSGACGGVVTLFLFNDTMLVGASGAIMGLYGAVVVISIFYRQDQSDFLLFFPSLIIIGLTLLLGLHPGVSNTAHITGLLTGAALGLLLYKRSPETMSRKNRNAAQRAQAIQEQPFESKMTETILVEEGRAKSVKILLLMIFAIGVLIFGVMVDKLESNPSMVVVLNVLSAILLPFVVAGTLATVWKILRPRPLMTLTPEGFMYSYGFNRSQFVAWGQVSDISIVEIHSNKIICVSVKNREQYLASLPKIQRCIAWLSKSMGFSQPVQIPISTVKDYTAEGIEVLMRRYLDRSDNTNN